MDVTLIGILSIVLLFVLLALRYPISVTFIIVAFTCSVLIIGFKAAGSLLGQTMYFSVASTSFCALPLFILMGSFAARGGFARRAYYAINRIAAGLPGSLAIATCYACAAFGAISGSALATTTIFGRLTLPEMDRYGYDKSFAVGSIAASGSFAVMIPPSVAFINYAIFTETSVGRLFAAGIVPGIITATVYAVSMVWRAKRNPKLAPMYREEKQITVLDRFKAVGLLWPILLLALLVLGGIYSGIFTPAEAAAVGCIATLILGVQQKGIKNIGQIKEALRESANTCSMVFLIVIGALYYTRFLSITQIPTRLSMMILALQAPPFVILLGIFAIWFVLGMLIIPLGIYALTLPILFPLIVSLGYDPIWFGVVVIKLSEIAQVTPPVGLNVFGLKGVAGDDVSIADIYKGIWPYVICDLIVLALLIAIPDIALWLPNLLMGS